MNTKHRFACRLALARSQGVAGLFKLDHYRYQVTTVPDNLPLLIELHNWGVRWEAHPSLACNLVHLVLDCGDRLLRILARLGRAFDDNWLEFAEAVLEYPTLPDITTVRQVSVLRPDFDTRDALHILNDMADLHVAGISRCTPADLRAYIDRYSDF